MKWNALIAVMAVATVIAAIMHAPHWVAILTIGIAALAVYFREGETSTE